MSVTVETAERVDVVDVTAQVESLVPEDADGVCTVFVEHTTAGVVVNEAESRLLRDVERFVSELAADSGWEHDEIDDNADAHLRSMLLGSDVTVPVAEGSLALGTWQSILLVECDGPRRRNLTVRVH
jgi:secondary thiamine-phosphate synthase enzyme